MDTSTVDTSTMVLTGASAEVLEDAIAELTARIEARSGTVVGVQLIPVPGGAPGVAARIEYTEGT